MTSLESPALPRSFAGWLPYLFTRVLFPGRVGQDLEYALEFALDFRREGDVEYFLRIEVQAQADMAVGQREGGDAGQGDCFIRIFPARDNGFVQVRKEQIEFVPNVSDVT